LSEAGNLSGVLLKVDAAGIGPTLSLDELLEAAIKSVRLDDVFIAIP